MASMKFVLKKKKLFRTFNLEKCAHKV